MKDDAEFELREWFRQPLPEEPESLHQHLVRVVRGQAPARGRGLGWVGHLHSLRTAAAALAAVLVVAVAGASFLLVLNNRSHSGTVDATASETPAVGSANPIDTASPTASPSASPSPTASPTAFPTGPIKLTFGFAGTMMTGRFDPTVTALADGRVLVAGGSGQSDFLSSAEVWDPATRDFTQTGDMVTARHGATATLLDDGRVLIAGGATVIYPPVGNPEFHILASAELYDPKTGTFTSTGSMTTTRSLATATKLADGRVLIAGGDDGTKCLASAELYDPATGKFSLTGSLSACRYEHSAALLHDGRVLVAAGYTKSKAMQSVELYDPATGKFRQAPGLKAQGAYPSVVVLQDGRVLIGGGTLGARPELFDPATRLSKATGSFVHARYYQAATLLPNGRVLIAGGTDPKPSKAGKYTVLASLETYDPATGKFTSAGSMTTARTNTTALALPDGVLIVGGFGEAGGAVLLPTAELAPFVGP